MKMDEKGKVLSIIGFEPIYTKVSGSVAGVIKEANQKAAFAKSFKESFNEKQKEIHVYIIYVDLN